MKTILNCLIIIIICLSFFSCADNGSKKNKIANEETIKVNDGIRDKVIRFSFTKVNTPNRKRVWKNIELKLELKFGGINDTILQLPSRLKIDNKQNIYLEDWSDCSVKKYDNSGNYVRKYGRKGSGPGEFGQLYDFDIIDNGEIAALDPNGKKFVIFTDNTSKDVKCAIMPLDISFVSSEKVAILQIMEPVSESPIQIINYKNNLNYRYQNFLDTTSFDDENYGMLPFLIGKIHRYNHKLVYISSIMGYVIIYNENGKIGKVFKLINAKDEIGSKKRVGNMVKFPSKEQYLCEGSNIFGDDLYVLVDKTTKTSDKYYIDVYSLTQCKYKYSLLLEGKGYLYSVYVANNIIYLVKQNAGIEKYSYKISI
jgi:hypothetical protein